MFQQVLQSLQKTRMFQAACVKLMGWHQSSCGVKYILETFVLFETPGTSIQVEAHPDHYLAYTLSPS